MTDDSSLSLIFFVQPPAAKSLPQGASAELGLCQSQACWDFCPRFFLSTLSPYFCQIKLNMVFVQNLYTKYLWLSSIASFTSLLNLLDLGGTNRKSEYSWPSPVLSYHYIIYTDSADASGESSEWTVYIRFCDKRKSN